MGRAAVEGAKERVWASVDEASGEVISAGAAAKSGLRWGTRKRGSLGVRAGIVGDLGFDDVARHGYVNLQGKSGNPRVSTCLSRLSWEAGGSGLLIPVYEK